MIDCGMVTSVRSDKEAQEELESENLLLLLIQQELQNINSLFERLRDGGYWQFPMAQWFIGEPGDRSCKRVTISRRRGLRAATICYKRQRL